MTSLQPATFSEKQFVVTGGCGFIGQHLVRRLLALGCKQVTVIDSLQFGKHASLPEDSRIRFVPLRLAGGVTEQLIPLLTGAETVFHLAAEKHNSSLDRPESLLESNVVGTHSLLEATVRAGVPRFVFSSSLYAYGRMQGPPFQEDEHPRPATVYGISKLTGEQLCDYFRRHFPLSVAYLRYMFIYGPRQYPGLGYRSVIVKNFQRILQGLPPTICGDGLQALDYLYVDDAVDATLTASLHDDLPLPINVGSGVGVTILQLTEAMKRAAGREDLHNEFVPADATHGTCRRADVSRMRQSLGCTPAVSLSDGLMRTLDWLRSLEVNSVP